jgi:hypothetical protein
MGCGRAERGFKAAGPTRDDGTAPKVDDDGTIDRRHLAVGANSAVASKEPSNVPITTTSYGGASPAALNDLRPATHARWFRKREAVVVAEAFVDRRREFIILLEPRFPPMAASSSSSSFSVALARSAKDLGS